MALGSFNLSLLMQVHEAAGSCGGAWWQAAAMLATTSIRRPVSVRHDTPIGLSLCLSEMEIRGSGGYS